MNDDQPVFEAVLEALRAGKPAALATVVATQGSVPRQPGSKMLVWPDGSIVGTVGGGEMEARVVAEAQAALDDGKPRLLNYRLTDLAAGDPGICGGSVEVFVEPLNLPPALVVFGAGHVGKAVAELAKWLGFRVDVVDDRTGLATPEQIPGMDGYHEASPSELPAGLAITRRTSIVAVTRGLAVDRDLIPLLLRTEAAYIGLIGSRRRWLATVEALEAQGIAREQIARIHAPIGLELGAETPKEIAISILAEVIMVLRGGSGAPMRWMSTPSARE